MNRRRIIIPSIVLFLALADISYGVQFATIFQSNMVLQRPPAAANIFGEGTANEEVILDLIESPSDSHIEYKTKCNQNGNWNIAVLGNKDTNVSYTISITQGSDSRSLTNVLFGDVWLCSGQSNMVLSVPGIFTAELEVQLAKNYPAIRLATVKPTYSDTEQTQVQLSQDWMEATDEGALGSGDVWDHFSGVCWTFGRMLYDQSVDSGNAVPLGLLVSSYSGTRIEAWSSPDALEECQTNTGESSGANSPSVLWNAMISPLQKMTFKAAIWDQGEQNTFSMEEAANYSCMFPAMISDWRSKFHVSSHYQTDSEFPFGFVLLQPYIEGDPVGLPEVRYGQTAGSGYTPNVNMPNTFMGNAMDLGDPTSPLGDIHPRNKHDVSRRLLMSYGGVNGPFPANISKDLVVTYDQIIVVRELTYFEIGCAESDGSISWYDVVSVQQIDSYSISLSVSCNNSTVNDGSVDYIRYLWDNYPCEYFSCPLYDKTNYLPGATFALPVPFTKPQ